MTVPEVMVFRGRGDTSALMISARPVVPVITPCTVSMFATDDTDGSSPHTGVLRMLSTGSPSIPVLRI